MNYIDLNFHTNNIPIQAGKLLIAEPLLRSPEFSRSVILLCEHNEEGTVGFVLNQPTQFLLEDMMPQYSTSGHLISMGGPVNPENLHIIHRIPEVLGGTPVCNGIFWGCSPGALQTTLMSKKIRHYDLRVFVGYSGWSVGQLENEMNEGTWLVGNASEELVFETNAQSMWKNALNSLGKKFSFLANIPIDPQYN